MITLAIVFFAGLALGIVMAVGMAYLVSHRTRVYDDDY